MTNTTKKADKKKIAVRVICFALAGLMVLSALGSLIGWY